MLHLLYILAFTVIAFFAIGNLIRSLITLSVESQRRYSSPSPFSSQHRTVPHPELLDERGNPINEPLLVVRSESVEDARARLDALYNASPSKPSEQ
ncbi:DUF2973 domain-containing protein [Oscillatoria sp. FACHB-1406]|uniref:DUF2973 domain-containing protein n=1 Tax=Oscillatoria sp. FACHB-1406 TaxID=2692846 RepID=UPI0016872277|nr:DUF2973 domain-containing protein [Oscillatoria sp. FACHB-1406]MBD2579606.1 DUF2973 domain-containing protein [Oscillatoria sp. FACHB-1406]